MPAAALGSDDFGLVIGMEVRAGREAGPAPRWG